MGRGGSRGGPPPTASSFPDEVWEHTFSFLPTPDRGSAAACCRNWLRLERRSRRRLFIGNCYAVSPSFAAARFPAVKSLSLKGKPHFADFGLVPRDWGGGAEEWVAAAVEKWPALEEIEMKRMVVSDECLEMIAKGLGKFRVLRLVNCEGFSTAGIAAIVAGCRNLRELDLRDNDIEECPVHWLSLFPESYNSLVTLNFSCLDGDVNVAMLERLVSRCCNLKTLKLNPLIPLDKLVTIISKAPQLEDLGTGKLSTEYHPELFSKLHKAFSNFKNLKAISGVWETVAGYLPAFYSVCDGLTSLNLMYTVTQASEVIKFISRCRNLQRLLVMDVIEDSGLFTVASSCKFLQELRVFPSDPYNLAPQPVNLTEQGLVAISSGCPLLESVLYFCRQMTNEALITVARNRPNLTRFRLCIIDPYTADHQTMEPLDVGFGAIVQACKGLRRLSVSGRLTDRLFEVIGKYADRVEMLSFAFAGDSDAGLHYILSGCRSLRKLEIRDCPFSDKPLLANAAKLETMRSLWMSSCPLTLGACRQLARKMPRLNVEVIEEKGVGSLESLPDNTPVEKLYVYRTLVGPRSDTPPCVQII